MPWDELDTFRQRGLNPQHPMMRGLGQDPPGHLDADRGLRASPGSRQRGGGFFKGPCFWGFPIFAHQGVSRCQEGRLCSAGGEVRRQHSQHRG